MGLTRNIKTYNQQLMGILWMISHCFFMSCIIAIAKLLGEKNFPLMQIIFFYSFIALIILLPFAYYIEGKNLFKTSLFPYHFLRAILGIISLLLYFLAIKHLPLTDGRAIALLSPVITFIFAVIFLKEKMSFKKGFALIFSLIGGYIIINPTGISFNAMSFLILLAIIMWSIIDLIIKKLSCYESNIKQLLYISMLLAVFSAPLAIYNWKMPESFLDIFLLIFIGIMFLINSLSIFLAIKYADLTILASIDFSGMIFTIIISYFLFAEIIKFNILIGAIIVFISSLYLIYQESKEAKKLAKISEANIQK